MIEQSAPPQCSGPDLVGWDWAEVEGETTSASVSWGDYSVVGTWDGTRITLTEPPGPPAPPTSTPLPDLSTPCEPPPGGWTVVDAAATSLDAYNAALGYASAQPDHAVSWIDDSIGDGSGDPTQSVLNFRFTGGLERHRAALRAIWGGPLCISQGERSQAKMKAIEGDVLEGLEELYSGVDAFASVVHVQVILAEPGLQEELDERYGQGLVEVTSALQPV